MAHENNIVRVIYIMTGVNIACLSQDISKTFLLFIRHLVPQLDLLSVTSQHRCPHLDKVSFVCERVSDNFAWRLTLIFCGHAGWYIKIIVSVFGNFRLSGWEVTPNGKKWNFVWYRPTSAFWENPLMINVLLWHCPRHPSTCNPLPPPAKCT